MNAKHAFLQFATRALSTTLSGVFEQCRMKVHGQQCEGHSPGLICSRCARFVCLNHAAAIPTIPPTIVCASCFIDDHQDLLREVGSDVIEAEVVE